MKKAVAVVLTLVMATGIFAGCGGNSATADTAASTETQETTEAAADETTAAKEEADPQEEAAASTSKELGVVFCDLNNPVFVVMKEAIEAKGEELGYTVTVLNSEGSSETELQNVQNLISRQVGAILILANDSDTAVNSAIAANQAGIPIVGFNRPINNDAGDADIVTQVVTDNVSAGETAAKEAIELLADDSDPKVAILRGTLGVASDLERYEGFMSAIEGTALENAVVAEQSGNYNTQEGFTTMQNILQACPDVDLVYSENDTMAVGAMSALEGAQMEDVKIVSVDGSEECIGYIVEGRITATVAQKFKTMGTTAVEWAVKAMDGEADDAPEKVMIDTELVTSENADGYVGK